MNKVTIYTDGAYSGNHVIKKQLGVENEQKNKNYW